VLLELTDRVLHGCVVLQVRGEVDFGSAPDRDQRLSAILRIRPPAVVLDLSRLTFLDCAGAGVLVAASRRAASRGAGLVLAAPRPTVARLLRITGLDRHFLIFPTVATAIIAARCRRASDSGTTIAGTADGDRVG
jgi:anti-sigma B factor antagonist